MNIVITTHDGNFYPVQVAAELELENLLALASLESGKPVEQIQLSLNGMPLIDRKKTLSDYSIKEGDMLLMTLEQAANVLPSNTRATPANVLPSNTRVGSGRSRGSGIDWSAIQVPGAGAAVDESEKVRQQLLGDPYQLSLIRERDPTFAAALDNKEHFKKVYKERQELIRKRKREQELLINGDPMDPEYQKKLYEMLQGKQIEENLEHAMEEHPESFGQVIMLYIDCELNGHQVKAFVDSGAQMTLISSTCAERCNVSRLIDKRFQGVAKGVGTQKILGRVHLLPLKIGEDHFPCTFSVLENQPMDMLLGLDMLKRHQCIIDLKDNSLKIGTTGTKAPFLAEKDIPKSEEGAEQSGASGSQSVPSDESVSRLVDMGFTPDQSKKALLQCSNSVELAASLLFEKGGQL